MSTMTAVHAATIREATEADLPSLLEMFEAFRQTPTYARYVSHAPAVAEAFLRMLIVSPDATIFVRQWDGDIVGMLGVMAYAHPMSGERMASELFWWLDPEYRGAGGWMLRRAEKWATAHGATRLQMVSPVENVRVQETYDALGYQPFEVSYYKELT
jgi:RimJ/RimL family protein N-acetyltransferase